jgi:hypothetical protein
VVLALLILIIGPLAALRTPTDIFPEIRIPVIGVVWQYTGLPPDQMSGRITTPFERTLTTTVNDIEHIVANSYNGIGIVKIFFQPNVDIRTANAQVTAISQTLLKQLPPGATPPLILNYNASTVPIIQLALSGEGLTEQNLADIGINQLRTPLVTVPGAAIPYPYGGKQRQIQIDLNPTALQALGLSGQDVANTLAAQNLITPVGTIKIGSFEYTVQLNNSPLKIDELGDLPIKAVNRAMVYVRDVATIRDGNPPQTNIVHVNGYRSVLMMVLKAGSISTLDIIAGIKKKVEEYRSSLPAALKIDFVGDQSIFVSGAIASVAREGIIAALLTSVMILLFLGSWRSTIIIATSIPLAVLGSIILLSTIGETLRPSADRYPYQGVAERIAESIPWRHLRVPAGRHRQPDSQFRCAGADRPRSSRRQSGRQLCLRQWPARKASPCSRRRRRPHSTIRPQPDLQCRRRPHPRAICRRDRTRRRQQHGGESGGQLPGRTDLFSRSEQRRVLFDRDADAAISARLARGAANPADDRSGGAGAGAARRYREHHADDFERSGVAIRYPVDGADLRHAAGTRPRRGRH